LNSADQLIEDIGNISKSNFNEAPMVISLAVQYWLKDHTVSELTRALDISDYTYAVGRDLLILTVDNTHLRIPLRSRDEREDS